MKKRFALVAVVPLVLLLAACGGGGGDPGGSGGSTGTGTTGVSDGTAQAMSANSTVMHEDGAASADALVATTQAVIASAAANQTVVCAGGGTAVYGVTGNASTLANGQLDAGEVYSVTYTGCRGAAGWAALDGSATLTVIANSGGSLQVGTTTSSLAVTLPLRTLTWNGSSTITRTVTTTGASTTVATRWQSPQIVVTSRRSGRTSTFTLSALDLTRSVITSGGNPTAISSSGTVTMTAALPGNVSWSITVATQGTVGFTTDGVPTQGVWRITLPNNIIGVSVVPGMATITIDLGADGSIDRTITVQTVTLVGDAG